MEITFDKYLPDYSPKTGQMIKALNVIPKRRKLLPALNDTAISAGAAAGTPLVLFSVRDNDGNVKTFVGTSTKLYRLDSTTLTDQSRIAYTASLWDYSQYGEALILCDNTVIEYKLDFTAAGNFSNLVATTGTAPTAAATSAIFKDQLFLGYTKEGGVLYPRRIRRTAKGSFTTFGSPGAGYKDLESFGEDVISLVTIGDHLLAYMTNSIWRVYETGAPFYFGYDRVVTGISLIPGAVHSVVQVDKYLHYVLGNGEVYKVTSQDVEGIGAGIRTTVLDQIDTTKKNITHRIDHLNKVITWQYASTSSPSGNPDKQLLYNYEEDRFTETDIDDYCVGTIFSPGYVINDLDNFGTYIDDVSQHTMDSSFWKGGNRIEGCIPGVNGANEDYVATPTGTSRNGTVETGEFFLKDSHQIIKGRPVIEQPVGTVTSTLSGRDHDGAAYNIDQKTMKSDGRVDHRLTMRQGKIKIETTGAHEGLRGFFVDDDDISLVGDR